MAVFEIPRLPRAATDMFLVSLQPAPRGPCGVYNTRHPDTKRGSLIEVGEGATWRGCCFTTFLRSVGGVECAL